jgi:hypothetical protein
MKKGKVVALHAMTEHGREDVHVQQTPLIRNLGTIL